MKTGAFSASSPWCVRRRELRQSGCQNQTHGSHTVRGCPHPWRCVPRRCFPEDSGKEKRSVRLTFYQLHGLFFFIIAQKVRKDDCYLWKHKHTCRFIMGHFFITISLGHSTTTKIVFAKSNFFIFILRKSSATSLHCSSSYFTVPIKNSSGVQSKANESRMTTSSDGMMLHAQYRTNIYH